jgi:hypothetical protein
MALTCPRQGCKVKIPDALFACRDHWFALSPSVRAAIYATNGKGVTRERIAAIKAAREDWGETDS